MDDGTPDQDAVLGEAAAVLSSLRPDHTHLTLAKLTQRHQVGQGDRPPDRGRPGGVTASARA